MESKQITPSEMARLMGFNGLQQPQLPVAKRQRVLSEKYLSKVASIGAWRQKHSSDQEQEETMKDVVAVSETIKREKQQKALVRRGISNPSSSILVVNMRKEFFGNHLQKSGPLISKRIIDAQATPPHRRIMALKSSGSHGFGKTEIYRKYGKGCDWGSSKLKQKPHKSLVPLKPKFGKKENSPRCSASAGSLRGSRSGDRKTRRFLMRDDESLFVKARERKRFVDGMKPIREKDKVSSEIGANSFSSTSRGAFWGAGRKRCEVLEAESKNRVIPSPSFLNLKNENYASSYSSATYPECPMSSEEGYQPSPVSVLEPAFEEEASGDFDKFAGVNLHGLEQQLEILKSESFETFSEGSGMIVSSDEESKEESDSDSKLKESKNIDSIRFFGIQQTRDFSYIDDVLTKAGFQNGKWVFIKRHSSDIPIDPAIFEKLEKNYSEHASWKRSERRLLFDRVNSGLVEILKSPIGASTWKKPVSRRLSLMLNIAALKEELCKLLSSQEKQMKKNSWGNVLDDDEGWLEVGEDIEMIVTEVESMLVDELVVEVFSAE